MLRIHTIDCHYQRPQFAASFLLEDGKHACFIENNTSHSIPYLLETLKKSGLTPERVEMIVVTHAHLDHAGGTAALLSHCPNAKVYAHPKAARTLIDPSRLLASAKKVYGDSFEKLYGDVFPIPAERVVSLEDNEELEWGITTFQILHTLGHATHHMCLHEKSTNTIFTGDAFGIRYPQVSDSFIFPSTSPIDFDPIEAKKSVKRIAATGATIAYLTHFGSMRNLKIAANDLTMHLDFHEKVLEEAKNSSLNGEELVQFCDKQLRQYFRKEVARRKIKDTKETWEVLELDITINAQGIAFVAERLKQK